jgi:metal-responsive CopG/Arc/MetJ family transcriptional regulator
MGRKPRGFKRVTVWLPDDIQAQIDAVLRKGDTRSDFIRAAIEAALRSARSKRRKRKG